MQKVPKTVLKQMRGLVPDTHPEADLLTAFAEQSLTGSERASVTEHLARCSDCREIVALALPANETAVPNRVISVRGPWLSLPALRWGVVAAGVVLIASITILQYRQRHQPALVAKLVAPAKTSVAELQSPAPSPQMALPPVAASEAASARTIANERTFARRSQTSTQPLSNSRSSYPASGALPQSTRPAGSAGGIGGGAGGGKLNLENPRINARPNARAASGQYPLPPASSETVEVMSGASQTATAVQVLPQDQPSENQTAQPPQKKSFTNLDSVGKAKTPVAVQSTSAAAPAFAPPAMPLQTSPALMLSASPRWTISADGALQRSFDAGQTWEDVIVVPAASLSFSQAQAVQGGLNESKKNQDQPVKKILKKKTETNSTPAFRAVSAIGPEVWAGGSNAILYHSPDSGVHWTQVIPAETGAVLTGDITLIEFSDPQNGRVATSSPESWITADGGQTWHKEQ
jgi:Photosynthesis system II assembly factor YCF48/Putative zinc-finger